ncbi:diaminopimelate decarboxylase [Micromonospora sediminicola]|uniref:Diaminopimelate decarboxylase n=1 Tax=Micromonospora sediminicola TaxID=946078 RepID=A0A1A9BA15_9ACTN|nr:alanine racemase [Micromonospora sediminicola]SBT65742.1 diaminopimelate decarboxylase [Micromonospora sediminicola]
MTRPVYVHDLDALTGHARAIRAALPPGVELLYAMKANPEPDVLRTLAPVVDGFETASRGELRRLTEVLPGRPAAAYAGPGKTGADLAAALASGVARIHVESPAELRRLGTLAVAGGTPARVLLRVNLPLDAPGASLVMGGRPSPFGMDPAEAVACARRPPDGVEVRGVHVHLASGLDGPLAATVAEHVVRWSVNEVGAREIDVGGGMAVDYGAPAARFDWAGYGRALGGLLDAYPGVRLRVEPGRSVTVYCGAYLTEVIDVKRSHGEWFAVVAGGTHHLRTPAAKGHPQPFTVHPRHGGDGPRTDGGPVTVVGQLCTPKDVLSRSTDAGPVGVGDVLVFAMAGAYAWNISHRDFLLHEPPEFRTGDPHRIAAGWAARPPGR